MDTLHALLPIFAIVIAFYSLAFLMNVAYMWPSMSKGYKPFREPDTERPRYAFDPEQSARFRGAQRQGWLRASWPFATLTVDANWVSVEGPLGSVWIERTKVLTVRPIGGLLSAGMFFESADGAYDGLIFRSANSAPWLALSNFGWPVSAKAPASSLPTDHQMPRPPPKDPWSAS